MATLQTLPEATTLLPEGTRPGTATLAVRSFLYAVFKHRRLVLAVFALIFVASAVAAVLRPRTWRVTTKVLVKLGETVQLAPAEAPSRSIALPLSQEVVKTEAEIVKSRDVVREAVERVGVKPDAGTSMDELIDGMQRALTVVPAPGSNVLQISYLGKHPERATRMVNAITDVYIDHHNQVYRNQGMNSFYTDQLRLLGTEKKGAERRLRNYLKAEGIVDIDQEIGILNQDVIDQEKSLKAHRAKIAGTARKLGQVRIQVTQTPAQIEHSEEYLSNPTAEAF
jgi:succinoglycan biosynthesis transport protein ExoP